MSLVFDDRKRAFPAGRMGFDTAAILGGVHHRAAAAVRQWRAAHYKPECHYMRGPGPACQRKADALARARSDL